MKKSLTQSKKRQKIVKRLNRHNLFIGFILLALIIVVTINGMYSFYKAGLPAKEFFTTLGLKMQGAMYAIVPPQVTTQPFNTPTPTIYTTPTPGPTLRPDQLTTFTSNKLGISFTYIKKVSGVQQIYAREIGNKIYVYYHEFNGTDSEFLEKEAKKVGKYMEVFYKPVGLSFTEAIAQHAFDGPVPEYCEITQNTNDGLPRMDETYERAVLRPVFAKNPQATYQERYDQVKKCTKYAAGFGERYFMVNPQHPDRILFVELGQDNIPSGIGGYTWDGTIKVF